MIQQTQRIMTNPTHEEMVDLISRIQQGEGGHDDLKALEAATGNPNVWIIFDFLELEDMPAETIFERLCLG
jgi:hypothetical protein